MDKVSARRPVMVLVVAATLAGVLGVAAVPTAAQLADAGAPAVGFNSFHALDPARLLDTRPGFTTVDDDFAPQRPIGAGETLVLDSLGRGGIPQSGVSAIAINVTAVSPTEATHLTVYPTGAAAPNTSNVNAPPGRVTPNFAITKLGTGGRISIFNKSGTTDVLVDVTGWFATGGDYAPVDPARLADTRSGFATIDAQFAGTGPAGPQGVFNLGVLGRGGVPASNVSAVVINVIAVGPTDDTNLTVYPNGSNRPDTSNVNASAGQIVPNLVLAKVGADGTINIYNNSGATELVVDVTGWFPTGSEYTSLDPARLADTRPGFTTTDGQFAGAGPVAGQGTLTLQAAGRGGVPAAGVAAVALNITATGPTATSHLTAYPAGTTKPTASNLNFGPGATVANFAIVRLGAGGQINIYNNSGSTHLIVDVAGWFPVTGDEPPSFTVSPVMSGLSRPWDIAFTPEPVLLFTERQGTINAIVGGQRRVLAQPSDVLALGEGGMMGIAVDPLFASNRFIYTCMSQAVDGVMHDTHIVRWRLNEGYDGLTDRTDILTGIQTTPVVAPGGWTIHAGCRTRFGPDGYLWVTVGDAGEPMVPQDKQSLAGKVLRIDRDGNGAPGNPGGDLRPEIYTFGHRNPQGIAFRPSDGQAFSVEHGPTADDEVNKLVAGGNYGWDETNYDTGPMTDKVKYPDAIDAVWSSGFPTIAPSGADFLFGPQWKGWDGALAVAVLKGQQVRLFKLNPDGSRNTDMMTLTGLGRLRVAVQGPDGDLYLAQDESPGSILRVHPS
ncbi:MAG: PQQ-dependent sugar dehydrogenase [Actinobacteria bacterium]|nr:PQQ-dependent sugar dehydrogenase [Actinomycetota bacterium]